MCGREKSALFSWEEFLRPKAEQPPGLISEEAALWVPGGRNQFLWPHWGQTGKAAVSHGAIRGDLTRRQDVQEVAGPHVSPWQRLGFRADPQPGTGATSL